MRTVRRRLLIVDDDPTALESLKLLLEAAYDVCIAPSARDALDEAARGFRPDAVLLDLLMPGMDGVALARELKRARMDAPVLVISADPDAERKARELGAELLRKPFTYEQLKAKLFEVVSGSKTPKSGGGIPGSLFLILQARLGTA